MDTRAAFAPKATSMMAEELQRHHADVLAIGRE